MRSNFLAWLLVATAATLTGCAQVPQQDLDAAKSAMQEAKNAQASDYAPDSWKTATDVDAKLDAELHAQEEKNILFRSYSGARELATEVKQSANRAKEDATTAKQKAKDDATAAMAQAREECDRQKQALASAPEGKGTHADLASLRSDSSSIESTLQEMQQAFEAGDYLGAKAKAEAAISAAKQIEDEIEKARSLRRSTRRA